MGVDLLRSFIRRAKNDWRATDATKNTRTSYTLLRKIVFISLTDVEVVKKKVHYSTNTHTNLMEEINPVLNFLTK